MAIAGKVPRVVKRRVRATSGDSLAGDPLGAGASRSAFQEMAKRRQRSHTVANNLRYCQHRHRQYRAGNARPSEPENQ
jgi:hypothetical protein